MDKARDYRNRLILEPYWNSQRRPKHGQRKYRHSKYLQFTCIVNMAQATKTDGVRSIYLCISSFTTLSKRSVISQFSRPYSTVRLAKTWSCFRWQKSKFETFFTSEIVSHLTTISNWLVLLSSCVRIWSRSARMNGSHPEPVRHTIEK